jgi:hypothetical protein
MDLWSYLEYHIKNYKVIKYLEIGTREGDSLKRVIVNNPYLIDIVVSDMWGDHYGGTSRGSHSHISDLLSEINYNNSITFLDGDSKKTIPTLLDKYINSFDLILVDGDHSYHGGMTDLINVFPLCKSNGFILFHDIYHVKHKYLDKCFDEFTNKYQDQIQNIIKMTEPWGTGIIVKK